MELTRTNVCRECLALLRSPRSLYPARALPAAAQQQSSSRSFSNAKSSSNHFTRRTISPTVRYRNSRSLATGRFANQPTQPVQSIDLNNIHTSTQELSNSVLKPTDSPIPSEQRVLYVLEQLESLSSSILDEKRPDGLPKPKQTPSSPKQESATSALLGSVNARQYPAFISRASLLNVISEKAEEMMRHPNVFITPAILKAYVRLQTLLHQPASFPDVFDLYARKPIPKSTASKAKAGDAVEYAPATPEKISSAIDAATARTALEAALRAHDLSLAIDVVATSFATPAFKRAKSLRQAGIPIAGFALAPLAAYTLSTQFSEWQQTMDPGMATGVAFAGIMTYMGAVSMVGYVAVTTANDQMDRVTWATGVPLWERWVREEERAAIDQVAGAWGFRELEKRGDEEGEEWESLKEYVGMRGMVLDRVSLMEGME